MTSDGRIRAFAVQCGNSPDREGGGAEADAAWFLRYSHQTPRLTDNKAPSIVTLGSTVCSGKNHPQSSMNERPGFSLRSKILYSHVSFRHNTESKLKQRTSVVMTGVPRLRPPCLS